MLLFGNTLEQNDNTNWFVMQNNVRNVHLEGGCMPKITVRSKRWGLLSITAALTLAMALGGAGQANADTVVVKTKSNCVEDSRGIHCFTVKYTRNYSISQSRQIDVQAVKINSTYWRYYWKTKVIQHNGSIVVNKSGWMGNDIYWKVVLPNMRAGKGVSVCTTMDRQLGKSPTTRKCLSIGALW